ncbi:hypothetical protein KAFR_0H01280 [Kazachstania africana CBS 2517]|uniref:DBF4-type domain-containing protein n=1 Tax=Kazachstania africana (strain ATCC 22294 / BCRC 22015 / CBS 2517 / CECT 1963 / NBRC 1671 / NRRL Y-8276) TaxID=1071382 RepID=H2AYY2_KAZAF|nr:hypothetical protein KAFR_0H01280 [Kazachstania africana CBS 2517]CCF59538.1 hypothetical protein KAFR_0H01280 [Kazachstania africana CBS 2517]
MVSPSKNALRSPLKETHTNLKTPSLINFENNMELSKAKRSLEIAIQNNSNEQSSNDPLKKKPKIERGRSIEGAVLVSNTAALRNMDPKVTPKELLDWQNNWKKIMKRDTKIYFDTTVEIDITKHAKRSLDKKKELLRRAFISLGAQITQFFDTTVTIVITTRSTDHISSLNDADILKRAKRNYMKVWGYEKAVRFLKNLDVDFDEVMKNKQPLIATPTLSNLLENEKLYGPTDRDPRTKRDDTHYFKYPHVYMYDLWQTWAPIVTLEWKPNELTNDDDLPYPVLKMGTFGRCPFIGDRQCDETSYKRVLKRFERDQINKKYALRLRQLYQNHAEPNSAFDEGLTILPHACCDSRQSYNTWQETKKQVTAEKRRYKAVIESDFHDKEHIKNDDYKSEPKPSKIHEFTSAIVQPITTEAAMVASTNINRGSANTSLQKEHPTPQLKHPVLASFIRQETEEYPDDLCTVKKPSRMPYEIKASGVHQSNDVATSFGNGLGPTKASVMSKNLKSLNRLVVDRRLGTSNLRKVSRNIKSGSKELDLPEKLLAYTSRKETSFTNTELKANTEREDKTKEEKSLNENIKVVVEHKEQAPKSSGYCENCRVKYYSLKEHMLTERHVSFADNNLNFEAIDSLVEKLQFQF